MRALTVGILAVQGAFAEHAEVVRTLGARVKEVRNASDVASGYDALILPGGESSVQGKLLRELNMLGPLKEQILSGMPTLATCAGLILLAQEIEGEQDTTYLNVLPLAVKRNAYGRQLASFSHRGVVEGVGQFDMRFIRAPQITHCDEDVAICATFEDKPVAVRFDAIVGCAFHPELGGDMRFHERFLSGACSLLH